jgi:OFA family oxalate/formate antiporter-like MFS transporter
LLCYGGGFGTLPSFVSNAFGAKMMAGAYGAMLSTWGAAGVVGPQVVAYLRDHHPDNASAHAFKIGAAFLAIGLAVCSGRRPSDRR